MKLSRKNRRNKQKLLGVVIDKNLNFDIFLIYAKKQTVKLCLFSNHNLDNAH